MLEERDYARQPLTPAELKDLFKGVDPRAYINPKSPVFKALGLKSQTLTPSRALELMAEEPNLIKRPILIAGTTMIAGFDRERWRAALK